MIKKIQKFIFKYKYLIMFIIGIIILVCRNSYSLKYPNVYAEDGLWLSDIMKNGFWWTVMNAREDYFTFFLTLMLWLSDALSKIFSNGNPGSIPYYIAFISYAFTAFVAILPSLALGKRINWVAKIFIFLGILLLPFGNSSTEILGRILQGHFFMWIITFCLLIYRYDNKYEKKIQILIIDIITIFIVATMPSVLVIYAIYGIIEIYQIIKQNLYNKRISKNEKRFTLNKFKKMFAMEFNKFHIKSLLITFLIICFLTIIIYLKMKNANMDFNGTFNKSAIVELIIRCYLYIFVWPFYGNLNDIVGLLIIGIFIVITIYVYIVIPKQSKGIYLLSLLSCFIIGILTVSSRVSITEFLNGYQESYPDRYYMLTNMCSIFPIAIIISEGLRNKKLILKFLSYILIVYFVSINIIYSDEIFTFDKNELPWIKEVTLSERIQYSFDNNIRTIDKKNYIIDIDPEWKIEIPVDRIDSLMKK